MADRSLLVWFWRLAGWQRLLVVAPLLLALVTGVAVLLGRLPGLWGTAIVVLAAVFVSLIPLQRRSRRLP